MRRLMQSVRKVTLQSRRPPLPSERSRVMCEMARLGFRCGYAVAERRLKRGGS